MTWLPETDGATPLERVLGHRPELLEPTRRFVATVWSEGLVDPVLLELCRLRLAGLHECASELGVRYTAAVDAGLTEDKVAALADWRTSDMFSERERDCLGLAEHYTSDPHEISDREFERVAAHFSAAEMVSFVFALATFDGMARMRAILDVAPAEDRLVLVATPQPDVGPLY